MTVTTCGKRRSGAAVCFFVAVVLVVVLLAGCATPPQVQEVPVAVSCVKTRPVRPQLRTDAEILAFNDYGAVLALRADRDKATIYIRELEDVVEVCANAPSVVTVPR